MISNFVFSHQVDEVVWRVFGQSRFAEVWVLRHKRFGVGTDVGEVAPASAGYENLSADFCRMIEQDHFAPAISGGAGAHHPGAACADDDNVKVSFQSHFANLLMELTIFPRILE